MLTEPKHKLGEMVCFILKDSKYSGEIITVDKFGIFADSSQPYYDILTQEGGAEVIIKHVPESAVYD